MGIGQTTIANYEAGIRQPNLDKLTQLADFFDVSIDELLGRNKMKVNNSFGFEEEVVDKYQSEDLETELYVKEYLELLLSHKKVEAVNFIRNLYRHGMGITDIYSKLLVESLHETGRLWQSGIINIGEEHYISEVTQALISQFSLTQRRIESNNKKNSYSQHLW